MSRRLWITLFSVFCITLRGEVTASDTKSEATSIWKSSNFEAQINQILELTTADKATQLKDRITKLLQASCNPCSTAGGPALEQGYVTTENAVIPVFYEQTRYGGGWIVLMQRYDGSVNFNRTWAEYRDGFGMVGHEFWMGLERMHQLTEGKSYELVVEMQDFQDNYKYAAYDKFAVGPEEERYPLDLGKFNGTTKGDSLTPHKGSGFSTYDNDDFGCSNKYAEGGWWYYKGKCYGSSLTGIWKNEFAYSSICWMKFSAKSSTPLKFVRMMIRPIQ
ncbi:ficolin-3-like [Aedes albopictus]|uniref:Fibrinogen C-terminal domain-containing protein n=1 Tax=Aedes albopictus TaxID=7160 RepID=A0ABM1XVZ5_AEDAL